MTIKSMQICDKCGKSRELTTTRGVSMSPDLGGWRMINNKHICAECIAEFLKDTVNA